MSIDWSKYSGALFPEGVTARERYVERTRKTAAKLTQASYQNKCCVIDGKPVHLDVIARDNINEKTVLSMPYEQEAFRLGDIIDWANRKWLVIEVDADDEINRKGIMQECNHLFQFQNWSPTICEQWGLIIDPYSRHYSDDRVVSIPYAQLKFILPYTEDTKKLYLGKRIGIETAYTSLGVEVPVVYKIVSCKAVVDNYGNGRLIIAVGERDAHSAEDSMNPLIANYIAPDGDSGDRPVMPGKLQCEIQGAPTVKAGVGHREYEAVFYNEAGVPVAGVTPVWNVVAPDAFTSLVKWSVTDGVLRIQVDKSDDIVGEMIAVELEDSGNAYNKFVLSVEVVSFYG